MSTIKIAPSILSADFARLGEAVQTLERMGADWIHCDVMDGHFVSNITFGPGMVKALRPHTRLPIDVHLMVERPGGLIDPFLDAGADIITFHVEAETHIQRRLQHIRDAGKRAGVVLNPATPACMAECVLEYCDMILVMSVNPGFGGQRFLPPTLDKIRAIKALAQAKGLKPDIQVDGGINAQTAKECINAGATVLVAGNTVFSADDMAGMIKTLRSGE